MNQDERWMAKYNEVKEFIEREHRNPSKFIPEERETLGQFLFHVIQRWVKGFVKK